MKRVLLTDNDLLATVKRVVGTMPTLSEEYCQQYEVGLGEIIEEVTGREIWTYPTNISAKLHYLIAQELEGARKNECGFFISEGDCESGTSFYLTVFHKSAFKPDLKWKAEGI